MKRRIDRRRFNGRTPAGTAPEARFWAKVDKNGPGGCWLWTGAVLNTGYGQFAQSPGRNIGAHRWSYLHVVGQIPDGLHLDHLCRVRNCVNPAHLEPVTPLENVRRGIGHGHETHCLRGHPYDAENTYHNAGRRYCQTCQRAYLAAYRSLTPAKREALKKSGRPLVDLDAIFAAERRAA